MYCVVAKPFSHRSGAAPLESVKRGYDGEKLQKYVVLSIDSIMEIFLG